MFHPNVLQNSHWKCNKNLRISKIFLLGQKSWFRREKYILFPKSFTSFTEYFSVFGVLTLNSNFEVNLLICQDGWMVWALDFHERDPWFKSLRQQAFLFRKGSQKFFKKWPRIRRITVWIIVEVNLCQGQPLLKRLSSHSPSKARYSRF